MPTAAVRIEDDGRRRLVVGVVCSLLIHAGGFALLMVGTGGLGGVARLPVALPSAEAETDELRPGIEQSRQVTINWLGFEDPTPHSATPAETEQAALSPAALGDPEAVEPVLEVAEAARIVEPQAETSPTVSEETSVSESQEQAAEVPEALILDPGGEAAAAVLAVEREIPEATSRLFRTLSRAASRAQEAFAQARERMEAGAAASGVPVRPGELRDAIVSEKEADATSRERIVEWEPGRPPAVEGLDIRTVRPRWTVTTKITAVPRNPLVRMEFRKNGTVARAFYLEGEDSGYPAVDGPLLDAIYAWTAKGRALEALPADDPEIVVPITMRIMLIPGSGTMRRSRSNR